MAAEVDVIVADGFVGNVALKISEGVANLVRYTLKESLKATITRQVGYLLSRSAFADFKKRLDHTEYGGAPLLGSKRRVLHHSWVVEYERHQERDSRGRGICREQDQRKHRERTGRDTAGGPAAHVVVWGGHSCPPPLTLVLSFDTCPGRVSDGQ